MDKTPKQLQLKNHQTLLDNISELRDGSLNYDFFDDIFKIIFYEFLETAPDSKINNALESLSKEIYLIRNLYDEHDWQDDKEKEKLIRDKINNWLKMFDNHILEYETNGLK